jgi:hypothetical protein
MAWGHLEAVADALDAQLGFDFRWRGGDLDRLLDAAHAAIVESLVRVYRAAGWAVVVEATFSEFGERGSIDVLAWHAPTGHVAVNEVKATVADAGRTVMGVDRKARLATIVARKLGWTCRRVSRFLVVAEGPTARRRIAEHAAIFRTSFPLGTRKSRAWIKKPTVQPVAGLIFLSYPRRVGANVSSSAVSRVRRKGPSTKPALDEGGTDANARVVGI